MPYRTALALLLTAAALAPADDWPHWMGPTRDNVWREAGVLDKFPDGGPKVVWRVPVAGGYSGPAVANGKVYLTDYVTKDDAQVENFERDKELTGVERALCFEEATGKLAWKHEYPVKYKISYPAGPRCTPVVHDGKVYTLGAEGHLFCLDAASGSVVWSKALKDEYKTTAALWGYAAHPLIDGKKLITLAGGEGTHVVALDKDTGAEIWRSTTAQEQGYSPPTIITAGGVRQLVLYRPDAVTAVDPETGKRLWSVKYTADSGSIIMSPVVSGEYLYVAGYSNKNLLLKLAADKPAVEEVWRDKKGVGLSPVNVQPFLDGNVLYGFDQSGEMRAVELPSGKQLWSSTDPLVPGKVLGSGTAFVVKNGDRYFLFNELGELVIAKLSPAGYEEVSRAKLLEQTGKAFGRTVVWSMPAFANKRVYARNDKELICVDLAK